ncbi:efflux RND transporter periplasmic adaptor subunit [Lichenicoccus sp.]|uniref:efflux RND transporter periplasmic adaptor subunit n=1 Tax=Lichenicoccus sp. TaxID=2781899 RepID=UPI003D0C8FC1
MLRRLALVTPFLLLAAAAPLPVRVQTVAFAPQGEELTFSGTVQARIQADLAFQVGGKVVSRAVEVGDHVRAGEVLARLDPADLRFSQEAAEAALRAAQADAGNARIDLARYTKLGRGSPAYLPSEYDRRLAAAHGAEARVAQAQHQLSLARDQSNYGVLSSDADGIVTALPVQVGQVVASGQTVATVAHTDAIEIVADVPENRLAEIHAAKSVSIRLWALPKLVLRGRVREIGALADPASRTFRVKVSLLDAPPSLIALGMTATVRFAAKRAMLAVLPPSALTDQGGKPAVWVLDPATHRAALRTVTLARYDNDGAVLVRSGIASGEQVITAGVRQIAPDMALVAWAGPNR